MKRILFLLMLGIAASGLHAQDKKSGSKTKVVKSGAKELKAADAPATPPTPPPPPKPAATALGDFDISPAPSACAELSGQERLDCVSSTVLAEVKAKAGAPSLDMKAWGHTPVGITFSVNQFGDIKDIRVEHFDDVEVHKRVMVALYNLPKFKPATKGGTRVGATIQLSYTYADLFPSQ